MKLRSSNGRFLSARTLPALRGLLACGALLLAATPSLEAQVSQIAPRASVQKSKWSFDYYQLVVSDWHPQLRVTVTQTGSPYADLYVRAGARPTLSQWDFRSANKGTSNEEVVVNAGTSPAIANGVYHIGVWRPDGATYGISLQREALPSTHAGMGAVVFDDGGGATGTAFRVWAPNAQQVWVSGGFNGWSGSAAPLASEGNGNWSLDVRSLGAGAEYKFVLDTGLWTNWRNDPHAKALTNSAGNSIIVDPDAFNWTGGFSTPAWNDMVIYEMHVGTFNDTVGGLPGKFSSAIQRLDHIADLGVNVVELMPICEFPQEFSWGYNYSHPFSVEEVYGGVDGLKTFIQEAHNRGIAVLVDVLYNHWGPSDLDLWQFDGWSQGGYGGIYFYNDLRAVTPWGDTRPDYNRPEVRQYIRDNALMWLEEYRADGLRWDSTSAMRTSNVGDLPEAWSLMQWVNDEIDWFQGFKINVAEDMWNNAWITKDVVDGGAGFDSQWDAQFVHPIRAALVDPNDPNRNMWSVRDAVSAYYNGEAIQRVIYTESHDEVANGKSRVPEEIWPGNASSYYSKKRSTLGAALVMTSPGIPMIFQGQEILEDGYFQDTDPVDWNKLITFSGIRDLYRDLIHLRRDWFNNTAGLKGNNLNFHHVNDFDKMVAFHRWDAGGPGDDVIVVANFANRSWSSYTIGLPESGTWYVRFNSDSTAYDSSYGDYGSTSVTGVSGSYDGMPYRGTLSIAPYSVLILSQ